MHFSKVSLLAGLTSLAAAAPVPDPIGGRTTYDFQVTDLSISGSDGSSEVNYYFHVVDPNVASYEGGNTNATCSATIEPSTPGQISTVYNTPCTSTDGSDFRWGFSQGPNAYTLYIYHTYDDEGVSSTVTAEKGFADSSVAHADTYEYLDVYTTQQVPIETGDE